MCCELLKTTPSRIKCSCPHSILRINTITVSFSVVEHNDDSSPSNSHRGVHFTHEPGVLPRHFSQLRWALLFYSSFIPLLVYTFFWTKEPMNWQTYKERLSTIPNQQVSASETLIWKHLSSLLIGWTPVVRHVSLPQVKYCDGGWDLWLRGNKPSGSVCLFSNSLLKKKKKSRTQPKPVLWTPQNNDFYIVMPWIGIWYVYSVKLMVFKARYQNWLLLILRSLYSDAIEWNKTLCRSYLWRRATGRVSESPERTFLH